MFKNSQVIVTGSSRGLGKAIAEAFLREGASVTGISRSRSIEHENYSHLEINLSDQDQLRSLTIPFTKGMDKYVLINNAGRLGEVAAFGNLEINDLIKTANLNYLCPIILSRKFHELSSNVNADFYVINIGSGAAFQPIDGWSMYCSTKAALSMFGRVVKLEAGMRGDNFKIVDLSPGIVDTGMQQQIRNTEKSSFSSVETFKSYHQNGELQSARQTADLIIRNFESLFKNSEGIDSLRNYK